MNLPTPILNRSWDNIYIKLHVGESTKKWVQQFWTPSFGIWHMPNGVYTSCTNYAKMGISIKPLSQKAVYEFQLKQWPRKMYLNPGLRTKTMKKKLYCKLAPENKLFYHHHNNKLATENFYIRIQKNSISSTCHFLCLLYTCQKAARDVRKS